ncbi:MAG: rhodanese-like domain-containing protein [Flavobacteriales bacterium]|nr:rhodanese-like domain-containing protein [Flavobacteriales bacterium]
MKHQDRIDHFRRKLDHELDSADLYAAIEAGERIVVVDTRTRDAYATEHIPAAINLPHREMNEGSVADLDRHVLYVTYCDGIGCNASTKGALKLASMGFDVKELVGGLDWWKRDGHSTEGREGRSGLQFQCAC